MSNTIQVTEKMAAFIEWAQTKCEEEIRELIRDRLAILKDECSKTHNHVDSDGYKWDDALEPNDGNDQWKHGGDCNLCRKLPYCLTKCRPNKLLKKITTPFLYECYLQEHPEAAAAEASESITPDQVLQQLGVQ